MANLTCGDPNSLPDLASLPIPHDINLVAIPGTNTSSDPMVTCCQPNMVQIVSNCTLWCEIPKSYFANNADDQAVSSALSTCLRINNDTSERRGIVGYQFNSGMRMGGWTVKEMGVLVLALSGLVYML